MGNFRAELTQLNSYLSIDNNFIDKEFIERSLVNIRAIIQSNSLLMESKNNEPTRAISLNSIDDLLHSLCESISKSIDETRKHNALIDNYESEKKALISEMWSYYIDQLRNDFVLHQKTIGNSEKAISALSTKIKGLEIEIRNLNKDIAESESKITSIKPTIDAINGILHSFGFTNFQLTKGDKHGTYRVIRPNGCDAKETLSEGEKTFITFLYFYHLTSGSTNANRTVFNRVLVIDDPVSSLDSSILFIVSSLVRDLILACLKSQRDIKQIFLLTHNVYFHKEVAYQKRGQSQTDYKFWIIRKTENKSTIIHCPQNPISTSYELLWSEIRNHETINNTTLLNTLRRILEYYFKLIGNVDFDQIGSNFLGNDLIIYNSLISWINDGSHSITDDIHFSLESMDTTKYLRIFEKIFEVMHHREHYQMMMRNCH